MEALAKLTTAFAALIGALAWPIAFVIVACLFKKEFGSVLNKASIMLGRVRKASVAGVGFELDRIADDAVEGDANKTGKITAKQTEAAARIASETRDLSTDALLGELDSLGMEYDSIRRKMSPGSDRTHAMARVLVKMRFLAPSLVRFIDTYKSSGSAGSRLAAVAMMQMVPRLADLDWLEKRFSSEHPFIFYHAALALQNVADICDTREQKLRLRSTAEKGLATVRNFTGVPDQGTIEILKSLISDLPN